MPVMETRTQELSPKFVLVHHILMQALAVQIILRTHQQEIWQVIQRWLQPYHTSFRTTLLNRATLKIVDLQTSELLLKIYLILL